MVELDSDSRFGGCSPPYIEIGFDSGAGECSFASAGHQRRIHQNVSIGLITPGDLSHAGLRGATSLRANGWRTPTGQPAHRASKTHLQRISLPISGFEEGAGQPT